MDLSGWEFGIVSPGTVHLPWIAGLDWMFPFIVLIAVVLIAKFIIGIVL